MYYKLKALLIRQKHWNVIASDNIIGGVRGWEDHQVLVIIEEFSATDIIELLGRRRETDKPRMGEKSRMLKTEMIQLWLWAFSKLDKRAWQYRAGDGHNAWLLRLTLLRWMMMIGCGVESNQMILLLAGRRRVYYLSVIIFVARARECGASAAPCNYRH